MSFTREILSPVTTAGIMYPALHTQVVRVAMPNMVARQFLIPWTLTASNSVTIPKEQGSAGAVINELAEGQEIILDVTPYTSVNVVPKKIGHGFIITKETIEDALIPVQQLQLTRAALRAANKIDQDCITTINAGVAHSVTASGKSLGFNGQEFVVSGSAGPGLGIYDLADAIGKVEHFNYIPDTLLMNPVNKAQVARLPQFHALEYYGKPILQEGMLAKPGAFGELMGLTAYCSYNCPSGSAYVLATGQTANLLGAYSPLGFFVERRPLTTEIKALPERDGLAVYITARYAPVIIKGEAGCKITGMSNAI